MAILEGKGLSINFGGLQALSDVDFSVEEGEIYAIIGPNGAGKTTIFNCISRIYRPDTGYIEFHGQELLKKRISDISKLGIARTFQNIALFKHMTVLENLLLGCHSKLRADVLSAGIFYGRAVKEELRIRERAEEIIDFLEIEHTRKSVVSLLPYGIQKRVELGRALVSKPKMLLLDEPMAGMNVEETEDMARFILDIQEEMGTTILMIEHDMGVVMDISDQVCVLDFGKKISEGKPKKIREDPVVIKAYLGEMTEDEGNG
ncbi:MAG: ABC transporter ATP-binding protein [Deltaproteobacteria bacterium]|nr:ABC transporter ATP-binding protein [Deltaproteobacteria bacterium]MBW1941967.1 ABC transporter ATP-binding protein [Deltaproteobacteria bacterium]